jgi:hypothetical protein
MEVGRRQPVEAVQPRAAGNSIAGIVGGGLGGQLLGMLLGSGASGSGGGLDLGPLIAQIAGGGVGAGVLMVIVGIIRQVLGGPVLTR